MMGWQWLVSVLCVLTWAVAIAASVLFVGGRRLVQVHTPSGRIYLGPGDVIHVQARLEVKSNGPGEPVLEYVGHNADDTMEVFYTGGQPHEEGEFREVYEDEHGLYYFQEDKD